MRSATGNAASVVMHHTVRCASARAAGTIQRRHAQVSATSNTTHTNSTRSAALNPMDLGCVTTDRSRLAMSIYPLLQNFTQDAANRSEERRDAQDLRQRGSHIVDQHLAGISARLHSGT